MTYLITYDLHRPGQHYTQLIEAISLLGECLAISQSTWVLKTTQDAAQITHALRRFLDVNDKLFVCKFSEWQSLGLGTQTVDWLRK